MNNTDYNSYRCYSFGDLPFNDELHSQIVEQFKRNAVEITTGFYLDVRMMKDPYKLSREELFEEAKTGIYVVTGEPIFGYKRLFCVHGNDKDDLKIDDINAVVEIPIGATIVRPVKHFDIWSCYKYNPSMNLRTDRIIFKSIQGLNYTDSPICRYFSALCRQLVLDSPTHKNDIPSKFDLSDYSMNEYIIGNERTQKLNIELFGSNVPGIQFVLE
ncbi:MAG: hypothetical protein Satyrvirus36_2 [Satyrvirus sp.]|uniref:Uncharacterized protein n=1 Tax=Satyrvirus sp. TaxID=2487771 RepID=A0A3G5AGM1_9VIRU|nr:MAG: hypothetical protein Satyrvirus36_2 [Satyrvirus sp.]